VQRYHVRAAGPATVCSHASLGKQYQQKSYGPGSFCSLSLGWLVMITPNMPAATLHPEMKTIISL
jgi:hypothetical protein